MIYNELAIEKVDETPQNQSLQRGILLEHHLVKDVVSPEQVALCCRFTGIRVIDHEILVKHQVVIKDFRLDQAGEVSANVVRILPGQLRVPANDGIQGYEELAPTITELQ